MKKFFLLCISIFLFRGSIKAQNLFTYYLDRDLNFTEQKKAFFFGHGQSINGKFELRLYYQSNKNPALIQFFTDSSLESSNGIFLSYYPNMRKKVMGNYIMGAKDGAWESWDEFGLITDSSFYDRDSLVFQKKYAYYPSTDRVLEEVIDSMGIKKVLYFKEDGSLQDMQEPEDKIFTKTEVEPSFPGGPAAWTKLITLKIDARIDEFTKSDFGSCSVQFIIETDGSVSDVKLLKKTMKGTKLEEIVIDAIQHGPKWIPAMQNGVKVRSYRVQTANIEEAN
jgi:hypothetical protein